MENDLTILKNILMQEDVALSIKENKAILFDIIPELKDMVGFEHNHPHHHLDVWEHTLLALSKSSKDFELRLVLLLHDIGKPHSYQDEEIRHFRNHPLKSAEISNEILKRLNIEEGKKNEVLYLIKTHDSLITDEDIKDNLALSKKRFEVQYCDSFAHNPTKIYKRINYLRDVNKKINNNTKK
jgi:tRNA nucleotidyltransferase (CCA-adding enzyme)